MAKNTVMPKEAIGYYTGIIRKLEADVELLKAELAKLKEKAVIDESGQTGEEVAGSIVSEESIDVRNTSFYDGNNQTHSAKLLDSFHGSSMVWDSSSGIWKFYAIYKD